MAKPVPTVEQMQLLKIKPYLNIKEVGMLADVTVNYVSAAIKGGALNAMFVNGVDTKGRKLVRVQQREVERWLSRGMPQKGHFQQRQAGDEHPDVLAPHVHEDGDDQPARPPRQPAKA